MAAIGPSGDQHPDAVLELRRVADRLSAMSREQLDRLRPDGSSPAVLVRVALQALADGAAEAERRPRRPVPVLAAHALADQLQVLARDALEAAGPSGRDDVATLLTRLRRGV